MPCALAFKVVMCQQSRSASLEELAWPVVNFRLKRESGAIAEVSPIIARRPSAATRRRTRGSGVNSQPSRPTPVAVSNRRYSALSGPSASAAQAPLRRNPERLPTPCHNRWRECSWRVTRNIPRRCDEQAQFTAPETENIAGRCWPYYSPVRNAYRWCLAINLRRPAFTEPSWPVRSRSWTSSLEIPNDLQ